jgi:dTDP-4-dehydrorhamnose 3,5-epimerase
MPSIVPIWNAQRDPVEAGTARGAGWSVSLMAWMIKARRPSGQSAGFARARFAVSCAARREVTVRLSPELTALFKHQDYGKKTPIEGVAVQPLRRFAEHGGSMTELARFAAGAPAAFEGFALAQLNYSTIEPSVIKAFHVHQRQTDVWFVPAEDRVLLVLIDVRAGSPTEKVVTKLVLGDGQALLVRIPPGVAHGCKNLGTRTARIVYMTDLHFSAEPATTDEGRLPWDLVGDEIWEPSKD